MQLFQGETLSRSRPLLFCLLLSVGLLAPLWWVTEGTAAQTSNSLGGTVTDQNGAVFADVTITLTGTESRTVQTAANGSFIFANLVTGGNYTVTPSKPGYTFFPTSVTYTNL